MQGSYKETYRDKKHIQRYMVPTPNLVHIIVNLYSLPFVIREYVCKQPIPVTLEIRGEHETRPGKID